MSGIKRIALAKTQESAPKDGPVKDLADRVQKQYEEDAKDCASDEGKE